MRKKTTLILIIILFILLMLYVVWHPRWKNTYNGYIEGRLTYLALPYDGNLIKRHVNRGQHVKAGELIFELDTAPQSYEMEEARANAQDALYQLKNLQLGDRPSEIEALEAQIEEATSNLEYYKKQFERREALITKGAISAEVLDTSRREYYIVKYRLIKLQADLITARSAARINRVLAAGAHLQAENKVLDKAQWNLSQKLRRAPADGIIFDTYYETGELVPADHPVASLLTPDNIKAIFFVPEPDLGHLKLGQVLSISCDHCLKTQTAIIDFISPMAEYTPPVIFSRSARSKLVYRIEAAFPKNKPILMHPGQPVDVLVREQRR